MNISSIDLVIVISSIVLFASLRTDFFFMGKSAGLLSAGFTSGESLGGV
ncbi:MAG: hypothetical protein PHH93_03290 [Prolixibacteraceae bacterium]|nr:hypothetical protein [Prolixibacteraceae bacterium]